MAHAATGSSTTQHVLQKRNENPFILLTVLYASLLAGKSFNTFHMACKSLSSSQFVATPVLNASCTMCSPWLLISKKGESSFSFLQVFKVPITHQFVVGPSIETEVNFASGIPDKD